MKAFDTGRLRRAHLTSLLAVFLVASCATPALTPAPTAPISPTATPATPTTSAATTAPGASPSSAGPDPFAGQDVAISAVARAPGQPG